MYVYLSFRKDNILKMNFPVSSSNYSCMLQYPTSYPYLYIDLNNYKAKYYCVNTCPEQKNNFLIIDSNGNSIQCPSYDELVNIRLGGICWSV